VHATAAVAACVAAAEVVGALLDDAVDVASVVASVVAVGAVAVVPAHPAMRTEKIVAAMIRMRHIITEFNPFRGKTSLKTSDLRRTSHIARAFPSAYRAVAGRPRTSSPARPASRARAL